MSEAAVNRRVLRRHVVIGIVLSRDVAFGEKLKLLRNLRSDEGWQEAAELIETAMAAAGLDPSAQEFSWTDFYEFMKWLIPLLLELFA